MVYSVDCDETDDRIFKQRMMERNALSTKESFADLVLKEFSMAIWLSFEALIKSLINITSSICAANVLHETTTL